MGLSRLFKLNNEKEVGGVWLEYPRNEDGSTPRIKISRMGKSNKRYTKALERATKPHRRAIELETMDDGQAEDIFKEVFAETIVLDWENMPMSDVTGNEEDEGFAPFSSQNVVRLCDNLPEIYEDMQEKARKVSLFRDEVLEKASKD